MALLEKENKLVTVLKRVFTINRLYYRNLSTKVFHYFLTFEIEKAWGHSL